ncbi:hypothetical protein Belba_0998 [Belliella baltica DSM 15883]|uniref:Uncharacterized protein n=1 Tax=Belliella baltica (strain DSM 15883 / CIP 108006 / LMG 21964 / BA134) TaxID=866536 RepID=I3Z322_BELBD|nr:hypothetical protein [Belliella baltica]AFL83640.1 hypothetical protein Belba_0998 [Belliella baltica DSM 15883]
MINFENIKTFSSEIPDTYGFLWTPEEVEKLPQEHKDQIYFLNEDAGQFLKNYISSSKMATGPSWKPFNDKYFNTIEEFQVNENSDDEIKKWLYNKPIRFDKFVYLQNESNGHFATLTWKMIIKYWKDFFFADDLLIFDETLNWGLYYFHENNLFFATDKIYDKEFEYQRIKDLKELKDKFFNKDNLNFTKEEKREAVRNFKEKYNTDSIE